MALKCECNRTIKLKQSDANKKGTVIIRCEKCLRSYFLDLVLIANLDSELKSLDDVKIVKR